MTHKHQTGFGNEFATEAAEGALPVGRNSPQKAPLGLYAEQFSGTAFTVPRDHNKRTWTYRIRPSVLHRPFKQIESRLLESSPFDKIATTPNQLRWNPLPVPNEPTDFVDGLTTIAGNGDSFAQKGIGIHIYRCNRDMGNRFFYNADGEMLIVPEMGGLTIYSELGVIEVNPGEVSCLPRGLKFRIALGRNTTPTSQSLGHPSSNQEGSFRDSPLVLGGVAAASADGVVSAAEARGYICENYGTQFRLPDLGPIGANGLANARDFETPIAWYEDQEGTC